MNTKKNQSLVKIFFIMLKYEIILKKTIQYYRTNPNVKLNKDKYKLLFVLLLLQTSDPIG